MMKHIHGGNVHQHPGCIDFSANCNPLGTPARVKEAIIRSLESVSDYPRTDCLPLREAIAAYESVHAEDIICGNGAAELIFSLCRAVHPHRALVLAPSFAEYEQALASMGCKAEQFQLSEENGFQLTESLLESLNSDLNLVFLCNPNNPTGVLIERELLMKILTRCLELGILLVVDECFLDFVEEPKKYTLKKCLSEYQNLFLLKAFTKRYAMAGVRLGYGISSNHELLEQMDLMTQPWNVSSIAQAAGIAALQETEYVEQGRQMVFKQRDYLCRKMRELGLELFDSRANYIFFKGTENLYEACMQKGILIRDCSNYAGLGKGYFRVAVKRPEENRRLIRVLKEICVRS